MPAGTNELIFHGAATITTALGATSISAQTGFLDSVTRNSAGSYQLIFNPSYALDDAEMFWTVEANQDMAASGLTTYGCSSTSDVSKKITSLQEAALGATSVLTDSNFKIVFWRKSI